MLITGALSPLFFTDLRSPIDPEVTVSDASESGGGLCLSRELSLAGRLEVEALRTRAAEAAARRSVRRSELYLLQQTWLARVVL